ncbi:MAG: flagellar hook-associated protein FlgK, partial [Enterobacteriaceae bacterium]
MRMVNIGFTGAQAARLHLSTTAMNMANQQTVGYSRRRVEQQAIGDINRLGVGNGVEVTSIRRISDQFLVAQEWFANSPSQYYTTGQRFFDPLESVLAEENSGINAGLNKFFNALNSADDQPGSVAHRSLILSEANSLAMRINNVSDFISRQKNDIRQQRDAGMQDVNRLSSNLAQYNKQITELEAKGADTSTLRDERDQLVKELSGKMDIRVAQESNGSYTITMPSGHPIVTGDTAATFKLSDSASGEQKLELQFVNTTYKLGMDCGGSLGALYDYESGTLKEMEDTLYGMAESLAEEFNNQLGKGFDLNGNPGKPLFVFDPSDPKALLKVNKLKPDELALSSDKEGAGNNQNLKELIALQNKEVDIPGIGKMSLSDAATSMVTRVGNAS